ncbi:unnamed protein product [Ranitomeya imitator]|uniref:Uncharacterized protein n=1 Tax=Ranitomeya imitator TaxID=111125 RepID=A0ABN9MIZ2_9NEOB|nr:unnamed protein product [Ranitomeya imitator]
MEATENILIKQIDEAATQGEVIIMGGFNYPEIHWGMEICSSSKVFTQENSMADNMISDNKNSPLSVTCLTQQEDGNQGKHRVDPFVHTSLRVKSNLNPVQEYSESFEAFQKNVIRDIRNISNKRCSNFRNNLTNNERKALKQIQANKAITIRPADKGGSIVILNSVDYTKESLRLLGDQQTYSLLPRDPTNRYIQELKDLTKRGWEQGILNKQEFTFINTEHPRIPYFYYLPKIHKNQKPIPPGDLLYQV